MKHNIILVGAHEITSMLVTRFQEVHPEIVIVSVTEQVRSPFEPDPMLIKNYRTCVNEREYFEPEPSKFIGKPKRNYKK